MYGQGLGVLPTSAGGCTIKLKQIYRPYKYVCLLTIRYSRCYSFLRKLEMTFLMPYKFEKTRSHLFLTLRVHLNLAEAVGGRAWPLLGSEDLPEAKRVVLRLEHGGCLPVSMISFNCRGSTTEPGGYGGTPISVSTTM